MATATYESYWHASIDLTIKGYIPLAELTEVPTRTCPYWVCPESHGMMSLLPLADSSVNCRAMVRDPNNLLALSVFCYSQMGLEPQEAIIRAVQRLAAFDLYHLIPLKYRTLAEGEEQTAVIDEDVLVEVGCGTAQLACDQATTPTNPIAS
jgi:hypothetical protein